MPALCVGTPCRDKNLINLKTSKDNMHTIVEAWLAQAASALFMSLRPTPGWDYVAGLVVEDSWKELAVPPDKMSCYIKSKALSKLLF